ncbi:MAG: biotin--[acetyl-CoA-carboxylase] ligase [Verrucomicrobia bacterium]|nr:biotin--[acetyl-CoA-carboxylase] ligase [Verrucomicrobiota bacterium]
MKEQIAGVVDPSEPEWVRELAVGLHSDIIGHPVCAFAKVTSTMDVAKQLANAGAPEGLTVIAGEQTEGRGRMGRKWVSTGDKGLYLSVILRPSASCQDTDRIALFAGVAIAEALEVLGIKGTRLKWPNDVLIGKKKIAGVLIEPRTGAKGVEFVLLGLGINVAQTESDWDPGVAQIATSCLLEGIDVSNRVVALTVLHRLDHWYADEDGKGERELLSAWTARGEPDKKEQADDADD